MPKSYSYNWNKEIIPFLFLGLPTLLVVIFGNNLASKYATYFADEQAIQMIAFLAGITIGFSLFTRRYRFVPITLVVLLLGWLLTMFFIRFNQGEFEQFFWLRRAGRVGLLFLTGWFTGFGFSRVRFFSIFWPIALLVSMLVWLTRFDNSHGSLLLIRLSPFIIYSFYIIYASEIIRNSKSAQAGLAGLILRRLAGFLAIMLALLAWTGFYLLPKLEDAEHRLTGQKKRNEANQPANSLTRNDGTGTTTNNQLGLTSTNLQSGKDSLLFVAKLDNFFPDNTTPNPLYFVTDYFSKFDTSTQTFEIDSARPFNDLFSPDASKTKLYELVQDSAVLAKSMATKHRKLATAEIYKHKLSSRLFTAPSTAFAMQSIAVPTEEKQKYSSAYRARMMVSDLNSAYFVYNPAGNEALRYFQEQRFEVLRRAQGYQDMPSEFMNYYTYLPQGETYDSVGSLCRTLIAQAKATTVADQVVAIRDYFLTKDSSNLPLFKYSDNPGVPGLPSANKLTYFLFENRKGYCAYFAGATLFMLRSLGIPCRIATGFLTVDRSNKNPGWYWFYGDQAHAWVQVYFPEFGWIDFDTTVPSEDQQQAPQPDQTPPLSNQNIWLVVNGTILSVDTISKKISLGAQELMLDQQSYHYSKKPAIPFDLATAHLYTDTGKISITSLKPGNQITGVSFIKPDRLNMGASANSSITSLQKLQPTVILDEVQLHAADTLQSDLSADVTNKARTLKSHWGIKIALAIILGFLLFLMPWITHQILVLKAHFAPSSKQSVYWKYRAFLFHMNQLGFQKSGLANFSHPSFTLESEVQKNIQRLVAIYQQIKYKKEDPPDRLLASFDESVQLAYHQLARNLGKKNLRVQYLKPGRMLRFFPKDLPILNNPFKK